MKTKTLNILFLALIAVMVILFLAIILISIFEKEESESGLRDITGVQSFEVYHVTLNPQFKIIRTTERYDDKFFDYLEHIQESRDKTFFR